MKTKPTYSKRAQRIIHSIADDPNVDYNLIQDYLEKGLINEKDYNGILAATTRSHNTNGSMKNITNHL